jgi:uncharacterized protein
MFRLILFGIPLLTAVWLFWCLWRLRKAGAHPAHGLILTSGTLLVVAGYLWIIANRMEMVPAAPPAWLQALVLLWGIVMLPFLALPAMAGWSILASVKAGLARIFPPQVATMDEDAPDMGRRRMLGTTVLAMPMLATYGATAISIPQKTRFRVRDLTVPVAGLPDALEGLRIAHVSDTHVGKFTRGRVLLELAEATNRLEADLVLLTGDLIDHSIEDLPAALDMVKLMDARSGLFMVEGNHDLFEGVEPFVEGVRERGIQLLRDQSAVIRIKDQLVEVMGVSWSRSESIMARQVEWLAGRARPGAFPILLAHHPHVFDHAARHGIPLTLAGHTHGGQLMLTPEIGPGPMMFRYWSGLYQKSGTSLVVSNGAGNWFPLRTAAPAEIVHITLRRA